ncbi:MAG: U32 family peptidase [Lachnospiraceae bacterium]|nr:U32 family peptidase [Lachnospiraceae bacterium]
MDRTVKTEILSPAGSVQALYAGIRAGADAVYIGGDKFGARAYADNPEEALLLEAIDYVHLHEKKIYLTVNTLLKNQEVEHQLYDYLRKYYEYGLDAVIVQDFGVFRFIRENFPKLDIHASTQMMITGPEGAALLKEMGATRIVTAREISLKEIEEIHSNVDIEIESFIHGAMCYSYSGQCLFSSILGGRSGNRGKCAGPCRQPYAVYENGRQRNDEDSRYVLSLRDMNTLAVLPRIIHAGVYSLKIEGRMKSPEYAAGTVELYRKYVDLYHSFSSYEEAERQFAVRKEDMEKLAGLYSRSGSGTGYYTGHNSKTMVSVRKPAYHTDCEQYVSELAEKYCNIREQYECNVKVELFCGTPGKIKLTDRYGNSALATGDIVSPAKNRPISTEEIRKQISKTGNTSFRFTDVEILADEGIFLPIGQLNELRRNGIETFRQKLLRKYRRTLEKEQKNGQKESKTFSFQTGERVEINCQIVNEEQLSAVINNQKVTEVTISCEFFQPEELSVYIDTLLKAEKKTIVAMPFVFREKARQYFDSVLPVLKEKPIKFMVRNVDEIGYLRKNGIYEFYTDYSVYAFNYTAVEMLTELGAGRITLPYELNYKELRNYPVPNAELIIYGRIPLMISANCLNQTTGSCDGKEKTLILRDRLDKDFPVVNVCNYCYNIIYNNLPLSLLGVSQKVKQLNMQTVRLSFTTENGQETGEILEQYCSVFCDDKERMEEKPYTRGHFNRGVE